MEYDQPTAANYAQAAADKAREHARDLDKRVSELEKQVDALLVLIQQIEINLRRWD